jgi:hypothetical protein
VFYVIYELKMKRKLHEHVEDSTNVSSADEIIVDQDKELKLKKAKPLPDGYVCRACGESNGHAIYDCPLKKSKIKEKKPKKDIVPAKNETVTDGSLKKLYVSGLPFSTTSKSLLTMLLDAGATKITGKDVTIIPFPDNPRKCKGVALVKNVADDDADVCIKLSGTELGKKVLDIQIVSNPSPVESKAKSGQSRAETKAKSAGGHCYRCGGKHSPSDCQNLRICYRCQKTDHLASACPLKKSNTVKE